MSRVTPTFIASATLATLAASGIGYALYFDYKRRNDPEFRRALLKEKRKLAKASAVQANREKASQQDALKAAVRQLKNERPPQSVDEREAYFLEQVAIGEALAAKGPAFYVPAAISFFKGLQVYPQPQELLMIYSKTQPAEVVQLLMEALKLSIQDDDASPSSGGNRRRAPSGSGAVLEEIEIDTDSQEGGSGAGTGASATGSAAGQTGNSSSSSPSFVDVEYPTAAGAAAGSA